jgi:cyclopropane fatty-acyl-phospholipid synthase-like methyltransferase
VKKGYWTNYWDEQVNGLHHLQTEEFLKSESEEKLFHLAQGGKLLDFGCGSADLLVYYAPFYPFCVGVDGSKLMLEKARERLNAFNEQNNVLLLNSDNVQVWKHLENELGEDFKFDCITAGQVVQYFDKKQTEDFVYNSMLHLLNGGKICLFDIVDSRTHELWKAGLFRGNSFNFSVMCRLIYGRMRLILNKLRGKPSHDLGYAYPPDFFMNLAKKHNLKMAYANSMYYEYRYHITFYKI